MSEHPWVPIPHPLPREEHPTVPQQLEQLPWLIQPSWLSPRGTLMGSWVDPSRVPGSLSPPRPGAGAKILAA